MNVLKLSHKLTSKTSFALDVFFFTYHKSIFQDYNLLHLPFIINKVVASFSTLYLITVILKFDND